MSCTQPPPITEDQISAAIDGEADLAILDHLVRCPSCSERLVAALQVEGALRARLHRWGCLSPARLADYTLSRLPADESAQIELHLQECAACAAEAAELQRFLGAELPTAPATPPAPAPPRPPIRPTVARPAAPAPAPALRGEAPGLQIFEAATGTVILQLRRGDAGGLALTGQLVMATQDNWAGALVEARQGGLLCALAPVDAMGGFACDLPGAAPFELQIVSEHEAPILIAEIAPPA